MDEPSNIPSNASEEPVRAEARPMRRQSREVVRAITTFQGPLPPPEMLSDYNQVFDGCAERIVAMTERQSKHRQNMEGWMLFIQGSQSLIGQILAFFIVIAGLGVGGWLVINNKPVEALFVGLTPLGTVAGAFLYQQHKKKHSKEESDDEN